MPSGRSFITNKRYGEETNRKKKIKKKKLLYFSNELIKLLNKSFCNYKNKSTSVLLVAYLEERYLA